MSARKGRSQVSNLRQTSEQRPASLHYIKKGEGRKDGEVEERKGVVWVWRTDGKR